MMRSLFIGAGLAGLAALACWYFTRRGAQPAAGAVAVATSPELKAFFADPAKMGKRGINIIPNDLIPDGIRTKPALAFRGIALGGAGQPGGVPLTGPVDISGGSRMSGF